MKKSSLSLILFAILLTFGVVGCRKAENNVSAEDTNKIKQTNAMEVISLTKSDFLKKVADYEKSGSEWKYLGDKPAIIDFYADWCGPCRSMSPILEAAAKEYEGRIYVYKVNVDSQQELASVFRVQNIPTFIFIPLTGEPQKVVGGMSKADLDAHIKDILK